MLLFRSEEHLEGWLAETELPRGATMTLAQQWRLALLWYKDRRSPAWRRKTPEEAEAIFAECGLSGDFWILSR